MHGTNLSSIDLNLLVVLDALLETRSATLAARRLALSQPATSHALARLRELFEDPLLVRAGRSLVPTPFALELRPLVRDAIDAIDRALTGPAAFDPRTSTRVFTVAASDYVSSVLVPELVAYLAERSPNVDLFVKPVPDGEWAELRDGTLDLVLNPIGRAALPAEIVRAPVISDRFVGLVRKGHPFEKRRMSLDDYCALGHVLIAPAGRTRRGFADDALEALGRSRRVVVAVPHFLVAPIVVSRTDYVLTLAERIAELAVGSHDLRIVETPVSIPGFTIDAAWHARYTDDAAHRFLRDAVLATASSIDGRARGTSRRRTSRGY